MDWIVKYVFIYLMVSPYLASVFPHVLYDVDNPSVVCKIQCVSSCLWDHMLSFSDVWLYYVSTLGSLQTPFRQELDIK
jgi:hypothetical protein